MTGLKKKVPIRLYAAKPAEPNPAINYIAPLPDVALLPDLQQNGGFGLVWGTDHYWHEYMMYANSFKLGTYLAAGLPVVVDASNANADLVRQNHLGLVVVSLAEAVSQIQALSVAEYQDLITSVDHFAELLRQGYFTKHVLIDAIFYLLQASQTSQLYSLQAPHQFQPKILSPSETLTRLTTTSVSLINLSLADIQLLCGEASQSVADSALVHTLLNIVNLPAGQQVLVGLPNLLAMSADHQSSTAKYQGTYRTFFNAVNYGDGRLSQPFANFPFKKAVEIYHRFQQLWENQDLLIISEKHLKTSLAANAASVTEIIYATDNPASQLDKIIAAAKQKLVLVLLGPAGHLLAESLMLAGQRVIDLGAQLVEDYENFSSNLPN